MLHGTSRMLKSARQRARPFLVCPGVEWPQRLPFVPDSVVFEPQRHANYEMAYLDKGTCAIVLEKVPCGLSPGDFCLIPPECMHYEAPAWLDVGYRLFWIAVWPEHLHVFATQYEASGRKFEVIKDVSVPIDMRSDSTLDVLVRDTSNNDTFSEVVQRGYLSGLLALISRHVHAMVSQGSTPFLEWEDGITHEVKRFIHARYRDPQLRVTDIANHVFLSPNYLSGYLHSKTGYSPHQYLLKVRMETARNLLIKTNTPISWVAEEVGFSSPYHFNRMFKQHFHLSPSDFRAGARQHELSPV